MTPTASPASVIVARGLVAGGVPGLLTLLVAFATAGSGSPHFGVRPLDGCVVALIFGGVFATGGAVETLVPRRGERGFDLLAGLACAPAAALALPLLLAQAAYTLTVLDGQTAPLQYGPALHALCWPVVATGLACGLVLGTSATLRRQGATVVGVALGLLVVTYALVCLTTFFADGRARGGDALMFAVFAAAAIPIIDAVADVLAARWTAWRRARVTSAP